MKTGDGLVVIDVIELYGDWVQARVIRTINGMEKGWVFILSWRFSISIGATASFSMHVAFVEAQWYLAAILDLENFSYHWRESIMYR